jgi:hypothetical protein
MKKKQTWICETCGGVIADARDGWVEARLFHSKLLPPKIYHRQRGCLPVHTPTAWSHHLHHFLGRPGVRMVDDAVDFGFLGKSDADELKRKLGIDGIYVPKTRKMGKIMP